MSLQENKSPEETDAGVKGGVDDTTPSIHQNLKVPQIPKTPQFFKTPQSKAPETMDNTIVAETPVKEVVKTTKRQVFIKPFINPLTGRTYKFDGVNTYLYVLRDSLTGKWLVPCTPQEFASKYKELAGKIVKREPDPNGNGMIYVWNEKELSKLKLIIPANGLVLNSENNLHAFFIDMLPAYNKILSMTGQRESPNHYFYVHDENAKLKEKVTSGQLKAKAYIKIQEMTGEDLVCMMGLYSYGTKDVSRDLMEGRLYAEIDSNPQKFLEYSTLTPQIRMKSYFNMAIEYGFIKYNNGAYFLNEELLGASVEASLARLNEPSMHQQKAILESKVKMTAKIQ
jgi:hypothetical protein